MLVSPGDTRLLHGTTIKSLFFNPLLSTIPVFETGSASSSSGNTSHTGGRGGFIITSFGGVAGRTMLFEDISTSTGVTVGKSNLWRRGKDEEGGGWVRWVQA